MLNKDNRESRSQTQHPFLVIFTQYLSSLKINFGDCCPGSLASSARSASVGAEDVEICLRRLGPRRDPGVPGSSSEAAPETRVRLERRTPTEEKRGTGRRLGPGHKDRRTRGGRRTHSSRDSGASSTATPTQPRAAETRPGPTRVGGRTDLSAHDARGGDAGLWGPLRTAREKNVNEPRTLHTSARKTTDTFLGPPVARQSLCADTGTPQALRLDLAAGLRRETPVLAHRSGKVPTWPLCDQKTSDTGLFRGFSVTRLVFSAWGCPAQGCTPWAVSFVQVPGSEGVGVFLCVPRCAASVP